MRMDAKWHRLSIPHHPQVVDWKIYDMRGHFLGKCAWYHFLVDYLKRELVLSHCASLIHQRKLILPDEIQVLSSQYQAMLLLQAVQERHRSKLAIPNKVDSR